MKRIFCIDRSVQRDPVTGASRELDQAVEIALYSTTVLDVKKQPDNLLNVLLSACSSPSELLQSISKSLPMFVFMANHLELLDFIFKWIGQKSEFMIKRGALLSEFEELRSIGLSFINEKTEPSAKQ